MAKSLSLEGASRNGDSRTEKAADNQSSVPVHDEEGMVTCPKCGLTQRRDRSCCFQCGTKFTKE